ncbi:MAG: hypothetical protein A2W91_20080 [Bacteroidetes bacterium GWF2_38_335]|nr:MAG: hypothetical protein A2W91_20080 [Bacteroidetes bacterium GWF2_38_335]OFY81982.1 MAG: hypothetical protein A2281_09840 [Bacteroidetes bacterium RIFOXYA12_FULL_38_20]HBS86519.1 hypothetical protein [Bacteroidales bacterium]
MKNKSQNSLKVIIFALFLININLSAQDNPIANFSHIKSCDGPTINFTDLSTDPNGHSIVSWSWQFGDGQNSSLQNPVHVYSSTAVYTVSLTVQNDVGGSHSVYLVVYAMPFSANIFSTTSVSCFGGSDGSATAGANYGNSPYSYLWSNMSTAPTAGGLSAGVYNVTVTDNTGCTAVAGTTINQPTELLATINGSECIPMDTMGWAIVNATGGTTPYMYFWSNGVSTSYTYVDIGTYSVTVVDANGCAAYAMFSATDNCHYTLSGYVYDDANGNCIFDEGETPIPGAVVYSSPGPFYGYTNADGLYALPLTPGTYNLFADLPSDWIGVTCPASGFLSVYIDSEDDSLFNINFGTEVTSECAQLEVYTNSSTFRPCFERYSSSIVINTGNITATGVYVEMEFDDDLIPVSSTPAWTSQSGNTYTFNLDDIEPFTQEIITVYFDVTCDLSLLGQTRCITSHVYPDVPCGETDPEWDHSSVMVEGECVDGTNVSFTITNTGDPVDGDMDGTSEYRVFENENLIYTGDFQLTGGESMVVNWPANGMAIRLEADQRPGHPGSSNPQETIEGCGDETGISYGFITSYPYDDEDHFIDVECKILVNSCDPNDKSVSPAGLTENHYVDNFTPLTYHINFQNTGTDTAYTVIIRDTLPELLDVLTVQPGPTSHPCEFTIYGEGILMWTFNDIDLVDSTTNEPLSHGFVSFTAEQIEIPVNEYGAVISNEADIYFDFNLPVITEPAWVTIWELPLTITIVPENEKSAIEVSVFPNPVNDIANFKVTGISEGTMLNFEMTDITGKKVCNLNNLDNNGFSVNRNYLKPGIYLYKITTDKEMISNGKLIVD